MGLLKPYLGLDFIDPSLVSSLLSRSLPNIAKDKPLIKHAWRAVDEDEEKFQREIMGEEPNLIKLYLAQRGDRNSWNGTSRDLCESGEGSFSEEPMKKVGKVFLFAFVCIVCGN